MGPEPSAVRRVSPMTMSHATPRVPRRFAPSLCLIAAVTAMAGAGTQNLRDAAVIRSSGGATGACGRPVPPTGRISAIGQRRLLRPRSQRTDRLSGDTGWRGGTDRPDRTRAGPTAGCDLAPRGTERPIRGRRCPERSRAGPDLRGRRNPHRAVHAPWTCGAPHHPWQHGAKRSGVAAVHRPIHRNESARVGRSGHRVQSDWTPVSDLRRLQTDRA